MSYYPDPYAQAYGGYADPYAVADPKEQKRQEKAAKKEQKRVTKEAKRAAKADEFGLYKQQTQYSAYPQYGAGYGGYGY
jgi:hypothetical protein